VAERGALREREGRGRSPAELLFAADGGVVAPLARPIFFFWRDISFLEFH
jgi:hypothetical protein